jgi:hypothetical protein
MNDPPPSDIIHAERLRSGIVITFSDGRIAVYSADLLRSVIDRAEDVTYLQTPGSEFDGAES